MLIFARGNKNLVAIESKNIFLGKIIDLLTTFMKHFLFVLFMLTIPSFVYGDIVDVISVSTDKSTMPKYFLINEESSIEVDEIVVVVKTTNVSLEFPLEDNPLIRYSQVDKSLVEGNVGIDKVSLKSSDIQIYSIDGSIMEKRTLSSGTYIIHSNNQSYKIIIK